VHPVLLDVGAEFDVLDEEEEFFTKLGVDVLRCLGPDTSAGCPVLEGRPCPKLARADVILCQLDLNTPDHRAIFETYRKHRGLVAIVSLEESRRWSDVLEDVEIVIGPPSRARLAAIATEGCFGKARVRDAKEGPTT
jgi:hypothetical protein